MALMSLSEQKSKGSRLFLDECFDALGEAHDENAYAAIERLVEAAEEVGMNLTDVVSMLRRGVSLEALLDVIEARMTAGSDQAEFRVA